MASTQALVGAATASITFNVANRVPQYQQLSPAVRTGAGAAGMWASYKYLTGPTGAAALGASTAVAVDGAMDLLGL